MDISMKQKLEDVQELNQTKPTEASTVQKGMCTCRCNIYEYHNSNHTNMLNHIRN